MLLPQLDAIGRYRWRGFGDDLLDPDRPGIQYDNAYQNLTGGDYQEWQVGLELSVPLGFRRAHAANRNAELLLCRARAILKEQQHLALHESAAAVAEMDRAFVVSQTSYNRLDAAATQLEAVSAAFEADKAPLDLLLDAQRGLADAESRHFRAMAEYAIAVKNVHFAKGTLLDYDGVHLSEGPWPRQAYADAAERNRLRGRALPLNYASSLAPIVSRGTYDQDPDSTGVLLAPEELPVPVEEGVLPEPVADEPDDLELGEDG